MKTFVGHTGLIFDFVFCIVFMPVLVLLGPARYWVGSHTLFLCLACSFYYAMYFVLRRVSVPACLMKRRYGRIVIVIVGLAVGNYLLSLYPLPDVEFVMPSLSAYQTSVRDYNVNISLWLMFSLVAIYAVTVSFERAMHEQQLQKRDIENQFNKARLAIFKAQISPHFLFNTLNTLYSLVIGAGKEVEDAVLKFAEIMRYAYITADNDHVKLADELKYIKNYIDLQSMRLDSHTRAVWSCDIDDDDAMIPPMLLLTFVENAFKYGASSSRNCEILINVSYKKHHLHFQTMNSVMRRYDEFRTDAPVGVENCRFRLKNLFPGKHELRSDEKDGIYTVTLEIDLREGEV